MSQHHHHNEKPSGGLLFNLLVLTPAVFFSLFIGGSGIALVFSAVTQREAKASPPAPSAAAAPATPSAPASPAPSAAPSPKASAVGAAAAPDKSLAAGQQVYMTVCFACHQPTGLGLPGMFPPLAASDWVNAKKPDRIIRMVLHGFTGPITINGKPFTTPAPLMPPQGPALSDQQIADALTFVRNSFGNKAGAVSPDQVKVIREAEKARAAMWTEAEIKKIADE